MDVILGRTWESDQAHERSLVGEEIKKFHQNFRKILTKDGGNMANIQTEKCSYLVCKINK